MNVSLLKKGDKFQFTPSGAEYTIHEVTDTYVSWKVWSTVKGDFVKPTYKIVNVPIYMFQQGLYKGTYVITKHENHNIKNTTNGNYSI